MIQIEIVTFGGKEYTRMWSDKNLMLTRDGALYGEAIDPIDSGRTYTESDQLIPEAEATEADYLTALKKLGVYADD